MTEYMIIFSVNDGKEKRLVINEAWHSEVQPTEALGYLIGQVIKKYLEETQQDKEQSEK